ncbi:unnamed protein product [Rotaria sp. Silwood1]|nr:unnamed protein product [Rotaria sp. Silwood1]CAF3399551.1 unnamed protein product [Rotaria sp. Silwood1]CAF4594188.1 unnamed protein product [Rotaria sp. Silwood1]
MWPILGPIISNQALRSANMNKQIQEDRMVQKLNEVNLKINPSKPVKIVSNIRYIDPMSSTCLILYSLILLLFCALPILALNIYLRQAFTTFHQANQLQVDN